MWENGNTDAGEGKEVRGTGCGRERHGKRENRKKERLEKDVGIGWRRRRWVGVIEEGERLGKR